MLSLLAALLSTTAALQALVRPAAAQGVPLIDPYAQGAAEIASCISRLPSNAVVYVQNGTSGVFNGVPLLPTTTGFFPTSSACAGGYGLNTYPKNLIAINLGDATLWGGRFQAITCSPFTNYDSVEWLGTGCPVTAAEYGCVFGNDDHASNFGGTPGVDTDPCVGIPGVTSIQSAAIMNNVQTSVAYVLVGSWNAVPSGNVFGYAYSYT